MSGEQDRLALGVQQAQDVPQVHPGLRVQPGGRLVEVQHIGPVHQGAGDQQPLGLPARQVGRHRGAPVGEAEDLEKLRGAPRRLAPAQPEEPAAELQVLRDGQLHVQGVVLGDHADPALDPHRVRDHVQSGHPCPAGGRPHQRGQHADRGGLLRTVAYPLPSDQEKLLCPGVLDLISLCAAAGPWPD
jgi:hypothetical protein